MPTNNPNNTAHGKETILLWDTVCEGTICALVGRPTSVVWENQVGGTACFAYQVEGICIPISVRLQGEDPMLDDISWVKQRYPKTKIATFLRRMGLNHMFRPLRKDEEDLLINNPCFACEAWLPVIVKHNKTRRLPAGPKCFDISLTPYQGELVILTYQNSD